MHKMGFISSKTKNSRSNRRVWVGKPAILTNTANATTAAVTGLLQHSKRKKAANNDNEKGNNKACSYHIIVDGTDRTDATILIQSTVAVDPPAPIGSSLSRRASCEVSESCNHKASLTSRTTAASANDLRSSNTSGSTTQTLFQRQHQHQQQHAAQLQAQLHQQQLWQHLQRQEQGGREQAAQLQQQQQQQHAAQLRQQEQQQRLRERSLSRERQLRHCFVAVAAEQQQQQRQRSLSRERDLQQQQQHEAQLQQQHQRQRSLSRERQLQQQQQHEAQLQQQQQEQQQRARQRSLSRERRSSGDSLKKQQQRHRSKTRSSRLRSQSRTHRSISKPRAPKTSQRSRRLEPLAESTTSRPSPPGRTSATNSAVAGAAVSAVDPQGCCLCHPYVQLRRQSKKSSQWKTLLESCPLCDAMDDDNENIVDENISSNACASPKRTGTDPIEQIQTKPRRSRSLSRYRTSPETAENKFKSRSLSKSRRQRSASRSHSRPRVRSMSPKQDPSGSLYFSPQKVEKLKTDGSASLNNFDGSSCTLLASGARAAPNMNNVDSNENANDIVRVESNSSIASMQGYLPTMLTAGARAVPINDHGVGSNEYDLIRVASNSNIHSYHDSIGQQWEHVKKSVRFTDGANPGQPEEPTGANMSGYDASINSSLSTLVTEIHTRPYTDKQQLTSLYYTARDNDKFRKNATLEVLAERAYRQTLGNNAKKTVEENDIIDSVDKPLLHKMLFHDIPSSVSDRQLLNNADFNQYLRVHHNIDNAGESSLGELMLASRKLRPVRKFLHREAVLYYL